MYSGKGASESRDIDGSEHKMATMTKSIRFPHRFVSGHNRNGESKSRLVLTRLKIMK